VRFTADVSTLSRLILSASVQTDGMWLPDYSPSNSATGCKGSTCSDTTFTMTMIGILSSMAQIPQSQPPKSSEMNTAAEFIRAIHPVIQVVTKVPTVTAIASQTPATRKAITKESNCIQATMPVAMATRPGPR
jgi:hypothetical protein